MDHIFDGWVNVTLSAPPPAPRDREREREREREGDTNVGSERVEVLGGIDVSHLKKVCRSEYNKERAGNGSYANLRYELTQYEKDRIQFEQNVGKTQYEQQKSLLLTR